MRLFCDHEYSCVRLVASVAVSGLKEALRATATTSVRELLKSCHVTHVLWAIYNHRESAAEDSGVKPKNISCINLCQDADYRQAELQAAANWQVQLLADKAITSVILVPSLLKSASNPLRFWSISMLLPSDGSVQRIAATELS